MTLSGTGRGDEVAIGAAALSGAARTRALFAASAGNLVEWFDFYAYAFTALYFSSRFFPESDPLVQLLATSGIFAAGFFMRPVGGWYFGRYADRHGRRASMVLAVGLMGAGSLAIGCLPTYGSIGVAAPALLLAARMLQGFSTGGEYGTAATYMSEVAPPGRRGFAASFQYVTLIGGQLLATLIVLLLQRLLSEDAMRSYGWRVPFLLGAVAAAGVLLLRRGLHETVARERHPDAGSVAALLRHHGRAFATVVALTAGGSLSFYTFTTYMQKYLMLTVGLAAATATALMTGVLLVFMALQPLMGGLSDLWGRRTNIILFAAGATALTVPILSALAKADGVAAAALLVLAGLTVNSLYTSVSGLFKAELFPLHVRALGVGLAYGVGNALFGGTAEAIALAFKRGGHESGFYWYVTAVCAVSLLAALTLRDSRRDNPLDADPA